MFSFDQDQIRFFLDIAQDDAYELWKVVVVKYECKTVASKADYLNVLYDCKMEKLAITSEIARTQSRRKEVCEFALQYNDVDYVLHHCHDLYYVNVPDLLDPSEIRRIRNETLDNC